MNAITRNVLKMFVRLAGKKEIRHGMTMLATWFAARGLILETGTTLELVTSLIAIVISVVMSAWLKVTPSDEDKTVLRKFGEAIASQLLASAGGYLMAAGVTDSDLIGPMAPEALIVAGANYALSKSSRPDPKTDAKSAPLKVPLILFACFAAGLLTSCRQFMDARHAAKINAVLRASCVLFAMLLSSCAFGKGKDYVFAAVGTNANRVEARADGLTIEGMNQTEAVDKITSGLVKKAVVTETAGLAREGLSQTPAIIKSFGN